ncbi:AidA/PixA family protein [Photorhabdus africana]|uniref:AidA/PixA family protein n=1 Tax=Photorhabdus africana TaxID=3097554 RepID=UPI002B401C84|nr:AidA/PixA family protein [Photorhabdus sp. CRI-LC]
MIDASDLNHETISGPGPEFRPAVDVIFIVDAEYIINNYPRPTHPEPNCPVNLGSSGNFDNTNTKSPIYIATHISDTYSPKSALSGDTIRVPLNSNIRWRAISISVNFDYTILLYEFIKRKGSNLISLPESYLVKSQNIPALPPNVYANGWYVPDFVLAEDRYFQSTVNNYRTDEENGEMYTWRFAIYRKNKLYGFYGFDPYIEVY